MDHLPPHTIIGSGQHSWSNRCRLSPLPAYAHHSLSLGQVGQRFGQWEIIAPDRLYDEKWGGVRVPALCHGCESFEWVFLTGLRRGMSTQYRIDNDRGYEPGNLRWASRSTNARNTRISKLPEGWVFRQEEWPYERHTVEHLLRAGLSREDILARARLAVAERRKCWWRIEERLQSMT